ncbi:hypothetical protein POV27_06510 [Aureisphaera galaxeae]|uniref:hypothetical protein n=1 Tax=Aureisphaera galaxeae TaxID=1538023 RepID=UPI0023506DF8|nr:hypothetical protein [Aureisphaera galaxeae]MDC8003695.1 hypothetical protein [Aureisphaera galaxeae]
MELAEIEKLLEVYFQGETTLGEEELLQEFFASKQVPGHLEVYRPMFVAFGQAKEETIQTEIVLPKSRTFNYWKWGIAASFVILLGIVGFMFNDGGGLTDEEELALAEYNKARETMMLLSANFNQGTDAMLHLNEFNNGIANMSVIDQFNESKKLILK